MCGRFTLTTPGELVAEAFGLDEAPELAPRYNIAPTQPIASVRRASRSQAPRMAVVRWGLIPSWSLDPWRRGPLINARAESAALKSSFREAFERRRCLIPADGFYEWKRVPGTRAKQPFVIRMRDGRPFAFAGLWEPPAPAQPQPAETCTIVTTDPNELLRPIHDRMPVILPPDAYQRWIDPDPARAAELLALLRPYPAGAMTCWPVGRAVNDAKRDGPECAAPLRA